MRLLIAEDEPDLAEVLCAFFEKNRFSVDTVNDGFSAYEYASAGEYDAIVLDVMMPKMNGYEATKRIRELPVSGMAHIPIIAMTANAFSDDQKRALEVGMNGFITKPIDVERMLRIIRETLQG